MVYQIVWDEPAVEDIRRIETTSRQRVIKKIRSIEEHPFRFVDRLTGFPLFKLRVGDYRAVLDINHNTDKIIVILVGHRSKVYDKLQRRLSSR